MEKKIIKAIKDRIKELAYSKRDLERLTGLTYMSIYNFLVGKPYNSKTLYKVLEVLDLDIEIIIKHK